MVGGPVIGGEKILIGGGYKGLRSAGGLSAARFGRSRFMEAKHDDRNCVSGNASNTCQEAFW